MASQSTWNLVLSDGPFSTGSLDEELYLDLKEGFELLLALKGVPIMFNGNEKLCLSDRVDQKLQWQAVGFIPETSAHVSMLDTDFAEFIGVDDAQATVVFERLTFNVTEVQKVSANPIIRLTLSKDK